MTKYALILAALLIVGCQQPKPITTESLKIDDSLLISMPAVAESGVPQKTDNWIVIHNYTEKISIACDELYVPVGFNGIGSCAKIGKIKREKIKK